MLLRARPVSIDIGSHSVKVAQLHEGRRGLRAVRFAEERLPPGFHWEAGGDSSPLVNAIRTALGRAGIRARTAIMALPRRHVTARIGAFPPADGAQLQRVVEYDLADHIPFPVDQVVVDSQPLGPSRDQPGLTDVLVVAAQREFVGQYLDLAREIGLRVVTLTVDALGVHDLVRHTGEGPPGLTLTLDIGNRATIINVSQAGRLRLTRSVALGGQQLSAAIRDDLGLAAEEAERRKLSEGLALCKREPRPARVAAWLENLCGEMRRSALSFGQTVISRIFLLGGSVEVPGLAEAVRAELGVQPVPLRVVDLFPQARPQGDDAKALDRCLLAIGQGLRAIGGSQWTISLLPRELLQQRRARRLRLIAVFAGALVAAGLITSYMVGSQRISDLRSEANQLEEPERIAAQKQKQVQALTEQRDFLRRQVEELEAGFRRRHAALELLRTISDVASPEVRVVNFSMEANAPLSIRGTAASSAAVADLQAGLAESPLVTEVTVERAERIVERPGRLSGRRTQPPSSSGPTESVSFVVNAALWKEPREPAAALSLRPSRGER